MAQTQVLVAGAGPTGLVLALWLTKLGVGVRIVDRLAEPGTTSRALAVQARTLELYRQVGLSDTVVERGHKVPGVNLWARGRRAARRSRRDGGAAGRAGGLQRRGPPHRRAAARSGRRDDLRGRLLGGLRRR